MLQVPATSSWEAYLELKLCAVGGKTQMIPQRRYGPLSVQRAFYPEGDLCHFYILHPPGGVVGGDKLNLLLQADRHSHSLVTTPGANKFYRSAGEQAIFGQDIRIGNDASLEFLPMENIYFPGAIVNAETNIEVGKDSQFIFWDLHCFGRPSIAELFDHGEITLSLNVSNSEGLLLTEKQRVTEQEINRSSAFRGFPVVGSMLIYGYKLSPSDIQKVCDIEVSGGYIANTQFTDDLFVIRYMGRSTEKMHLAFREIWALLRTPLLGRPICAPRIWNT